jgi:hypothetical protein
LAGVEKVIGKKKASKKKNTPCFYKKSELISGMILARSIFFIV